MIAGATLARLKMAIVLFSTTMRHACFPATRAEILALGGPNCQMLASASHVFQINIVRLGIATAGGVHLDRPRTFESVKLHCRRNETPSDSRPAIRPCLANLPVCGARP